MTRKNKGNITQKCYSLNGPLPEQLVKQSIVSNGGVEQWVRTAGDDVVLAASAACDKFLEAHSRVASCQAAAQAARKEVEDAHRCLVYAKAGHTSALIAHDLALSDLDAATAACDEAMALSSAAFALVRVRMETLTRSAA